MKTKLAILVAILATAAFAQVVIDSQTATVTRTRVRTETIFRNDADTGALLSVEVRTWDITRVGSVELKREPGPAFTLTPAQIAATLPGFDQMQAAFAAAANQMMTNQP